MVGLLPKIGATIKISFADDTIGCVGIVYLSSGRFPLDTVEC